ncbi:MAG: MBOAT family protein [Verrucomicrobiae bacterium]|nr:MBOAT family protein [Verrucomicrobiae bacterium]
MLFNTIEYFIFLPIVLALYYALNQRWQNRLLLAASYFFYGWWDWRFVSLLMISTVVDFFLALAIHRTEEPRRRKRWLIFSCLVNFGMLGFFKYFNFFVHSASEAFRALGLEVDAPTLHIILPAGISFYTFQTMNYVIDVYRREMEPTRDFLSYAVFVSYFPHLVAGPIMRAELLLPQITSKRVVTNEHLRTGCLLIFIGLFKKVVLADSVAADVERCYANPANYTSFELLQAFYFFAIQVYGDFSGYTDIARGTSRLLGIELPENFNQPYLSRSITEFWRRWHISLSQWIQDYLFMPLQMRWREGGSLATAAALMITFLLCGLWHGANWTFVVWGGLHGAYMVVHRFTLKLFPQAAKKRRGPLVSLLKILFVFHLVSFTWIFFRAADFTTAFVYLTGILNWHGAISLEDVAQPLFYALLTLGLDVPQFRSGDHTIMLRWHWLPRGAVYAAMAVMLMVMRTDREIPFIYFQF